LILEKVSLPDVDRLVDRAIDLRLKSVKQSNKYVIYTSYDSIYIERDTNHFDGISRKGSEEAGLRRIVFMAE
jgi:hypothetical protein